MSRYIIETDMNPVDLLSVLDKLGKKASIQKVWDWERDEETEADYKQLVELVTSRKNPAIINHLLQDEGE